MQDHFITKSIRHPHLPNKNAVFANKYLHFSFIATKKQRKNPFCALRRFFQKERDAYGCELRFLQKGKKTAEALSFLS
jgi:hypothetical protein